MTNFFLLMSISIIPGQVPGRDPAVIGMRPFASLTELLVDIDNNYTRLGTIRQQHLTRKKEFEKAAMDLRRERADLQKENAELAQARAALDARKSEAPNAGFRVKLKGDKIVDDYHFINHPYKDFGTYEEAASWLKENGGGKGGYVLDKATNEEVTAPPAKKDNSAIQAEMRRLAARQRDYDAKKRELEMRKAELGQGLQALAMSADEYNSLADNLSKKIAALPDPRKALDNAHLIYDENAPKGGKLDPAFENMKTMLSKKSVGTGECTELPRALNGLGPSSTWQPGDRVLGGGPFIPFRSAATFIGDKDHPYPNLPHGNHAVGYVLDSYKDPASGRGVVLVFDQWKDKPPGMRLMRSKGGINDPVNQQKIKEGREEAERKGYKPDGPSREKYYRTMFDGKRYYNPGDDADNLRYIESHK